jgi:septum formation protein
MPASFYTGKMLMLASQSPRRAEILRQAGIPFEVRAADIDETPLIGERAEDFVRRLAEAKALAVEGELVLAADTTVVVDDAILEKPVDAADAVRMISLLSGRRHQVMTGICLRRGEQRIVDAAITDVWFSAMSASDIAEYVASGEPMGKAGGYGIQGLASKYVERIEGCYFNVVGLPVSMVWRYLQSEFPGWQVEARNLQK